MLVLLETLHGGWVILLQVEQHARVHVTEFGLDILHGADDPINGVFTALAQGADAGVLAGAHPVEDLQHEVGLVAAVFVEGLLGDAECAGEVVHADGPDSVASERLLTAIQQLVEPGILSGALKGWRHPDALSGRKSTR